MAYPVGKLKIECHPRLACATLGLKSFFPFLPERFLGLEKHRSTRSVITSKPAICDHFKTGQRSRAQDM